MNQENNQNSIKNLKSETPFLDEYIGEFNQPDFSTNKHDPISNKDFKIKKEIFNQPVNPKKEEILEKVLSSNFLNIDGIKSDAKTPFD